MVAGPDQNRMPTARKRRSASAGRRESRNQATPDISPDIITDEGIRGLLEDWLIPIIVEGMIQDRIEKPCGSHSPP